MWERSQKVWWLLELITVAQYSSVMKVKFNWKHLVVDKKQIHEFQHLKAALMFIAGTQTHHLGPQISRPFIIVILVNSQLMPSLITNILACVFLKVISQVSLKLFLKNPNEESTFSTDYIQNKVGCGANQQLSVMEGWILLLVSKS